MVQNLKQGITPAWLKSCWLNTCVS